MPMDLPRGSRLGSYEVVAPLASGGMAEVYSARDPRFGRDVAIKVIAPELLTDRAARARFEREMAVVAKLTHPRICTLLDLGAEGDQLYFVMELMRGETLATRLDRAGGRGLPLTEALDIASGLCEALAYAHRNGVVHRDVKPANIMLTASGVKLLDFGVARLRSQDDVIDAKAGTVGPILIGTPAYMAPELLDGLADARSDLFSLGAVLYEMLAGQRAFPGETSSDIVGAVVRCAPRPLAELRTDVPAAVIRLVERSLRRSADDRWQSAADLGEAIRWARDAQGLAASLAAPPRVGFRRGLWAVAALLPPALVGAGFMLGRQGPTPPAAQFYVHDLAIPDGERFVTGHGAVSRDGLRIAIVTQPVAVGGRGTTLWTREIGGAGGWQLFDGGVAEVTYPSWSPDGRALIYFRAGKLVRLTLASAVPVTLADAPNGRGTAWLDDDTVLFAPDAQGDLWRVPAAGGTASVLVRRREGELGVKFPVALDGGQFLFWVQRPDQATSEIRVATVNAPEQARTIVQSPMAGVHTDGYLYFVRDRRLVAQRLDEETLTLTGRAEPVPAETGMGGQVGSPYVAASGGVTAVTSVRRETRALTWVDRTGASLGTVGEVAAYRTMTLSPRGHQLLVERAEPGVDLASVWLLDFESGASRPIVTEVGAQHAVWHPDQNRVAYRASVGPGGNAAIYEQALGTGARRALVEILAASARPAGWVDGSRLLWWAGDVSGRFNGIFLGAGAEAQPYRRIRVGAEPDHVTPRPGGGAVAYVSNESGVAEVYVDALPAPRASAWRVSRGGGTLPKWSRDGRELFFVSDGTVHVVAMNGPQGGPSAPPRRLFGFEGHDFDVHPDGRLLIQRRRRPEAYYLRVFRNWSMRPTTDEGGKLPIRAAS